MVRPRRTVPVNPPEPDFATIVANLQQQLLAHQRETDRLREQLAQMNQRPQVNEVPPPVHQVPPVVPPMPEVQPEIPRNAEVPLAPAGMQVNPPVREDLLYERFRRMKAPEFEGPSDPIAADNRLIDIQDARHWWMIVQRRRNVTTMSWQDFVTEFRTMYYNREVIAVQQDEFTNLKQGFMTVMEAVKKFEQLARLCPELVPNETEKVRRMMKMFRADISSKTRKQGLEILKLEGKKRLWANKRITLRRGIIEEMRVITLTTRCALSAERNTGECVEWGRMLATCVARRGITLGTAPITPRTRTFHIQAGMRTVSFMRFKPGLKDLQSHKAD
ncbi:hypothetical protein TIFTF001_047838 [Ficus carica]|uniref:Retrotransposon gag domain-containing protein n=1 Tax=Ficus carica TaxID=3494 RepID=A0AA87Z015_FICCA|nr:hypothetical protein TIFTF001_047836 [Ficus carica]GMN26868.1 hypothetical protein TIFTF001_047838 [Ficus carica]